MKDVCVERQVQALGPIDLPTLAMGSSAAAQVGDRVVVGGLQRVMPGVKVQAKLTRTATATAVEDTTLIPITWELILRKLDLAREVVAPSEDVLRRLTREELADLLAWMK